MSIKQLIDDNDKSKQKPFIMKSENSKLKLKQRNKQFAESSHCQGNSPIPRRNDKVNAFLQAQTKPFRIAKSSTKRKMWPNEKAQNDFPTSLPQIHLIDNKAIEKDKSNNELFSISNMNRNKQFKLHTFYSNSKAEGNMLRTQLMNHPSAVKQHMQIDNVAVSRVQQMFKLKKSYLSTMVRYSCLSKPGTTINGSGKTNQDSYLSKHKIFNLSNYSLFGVFDGHGINGHYVSRYLRDFFLSHFSQLDTFNPLLPQSVAVKEKNISEALCNHFLLNSFLIAESKLKKAKIDLTFSGSTGVIVIHIEDRLVCLNTGDSRAIYIDDEGNAIQISRDHKPNLSDEEKRIKSKGGRVDRSPGASYLGPFRVWRKSEEYPGLAMSRSFGDSIAKTIGVISEPEVYELSIIKQRIRAVVIASDGLWEFISNEMVSMMLRPYLLENDCYGANKRLMKEAHTSWIRNGFPIDDITIIVLFFRTD